MEQPRKTVRVVAAIIHENKTVLATQRGYGAYKDFWEFPGGKIEPGESPEEALVREIHEELAAEISVERHFMTVEHDYPAFHLLMECYLCRVAHGRLQLLEHESAAWLTRDKLCSVNWLPADLKVIAQLENTWQK